MARFSSRNIKNEIQEIHFNENGEWSDEDIFLMILVIFMNLLLYDPSNSMWSE